MDIYPRYMNVGSYCYPTTPIHPDPYNVDLSTYSERSFCDASVFEGYAKPNSCSTSWATEAVTVAERVLKDQGYDVRLSVDYLVKCLAEDLKRDACDGFYNKEIFGFIVDNGLISEEDAAKLGNDICQPSEDMLYTFEAQEIECPNKGNLMNFLVESKHVDVMIALDMHKIRFVNDLIGEDDAPFTGATMQPTMWAIVTGYADSTPSEDGVWYLETFVSPCEKIEFKIPLRDNETNANYAGIAGYAYSLQFIGAPTDAPTTEVPTTEAPTEAPTTEAPTTELPTTEAPTTEPPTTEAPTTELPTTEAPTTEAPTTLPPTTPPPQSAEFTEDLCKDKFDTLDRAVSDFIFTGACTDIEDLDFSEFTYLRTITIGGSRSTYALENLKTVKVENMEYLTDIMIYNNNAANRDELPTQCDEGTSVVISGNPELVNLHFGVSSFTGYCSLTVENNAKLQTLSFGSKQSDGTVLRNVYSANFYAVSSVVISNNPVLERIDVAGGVMENFNRLELAELSSLQALEIYGSGMAGRNDHDEAAAELVMKGR